jgi:hypothetical protein
LKLILRTVRSHDLKSVFGAENAHAIGKSLGDLRRTTGRLTSDQLALIDKVVPQNEFVVKGSLRGVRKLP